MVSRNDDDNIVGCDLILVAVPFFSMCCHGAHVSDDLPSSSMRQSGLRNFSVLGPMRRASSDELPAGPMDREAPTRAQGGCDSRPAGVVSATAMTECASGSHPRTKKKSRADFALTMLRDRLEENERRRCSVEQECLLLRHGYEGEMKQARGENHALAQACDSMRGEYDRFRAEVSDIVGKMSHAER